MAPRERHRVGELHERDARGEWPLHVDRPCRDRQRRRALEHRRVLRPAGSSKLTGVVGSTGTRAVFRIWTMLKTLSPSSPTSKTNRD